MLNGTLLNISFIFNYKFNKYICIISISKGYKFNLGDEFLKKIIKSKKLKIVAFIIVITAMGCIDYSKEKEDEVSDITSMVKFNNYSVQKNIRLLNNKDLDCKIGVYSWHITELLDETLMVADLCNNFKINEIFQEIPSNYLNDDLAKTINELQNNVPKEIEISYLCGDPSWYKDSSYGKLKIDELVNYNFNYGANYKIEKIVFDIEPWVLGKSNWEEDLLKTIQEIYYYANLKEITVLFTIPFWLDTSEDINNEIIYKEIIKNSHGIIVMNYNRYVYDEAIDNELCYAKENGKIIYSAAETQPPTNAYGVYDSTTYYNIGLDRLKSDWDYLKNKYQYSNLGFVYHDLSSLKNIIYNVKLL